MAISKRYKLQYCQDMSAFGFGVNSFTIGIYKSKETAEHTLSELVKENEKFGQYSKIYEIEYEE